MRKFKTEDELKAMARSVCGNIVERATESKPEIRRKATPEERSTMFKIMYGVLLELNNIAACTSRDSADTSILYMMEKEAIDTSEFIFMMFFRKCNSYASFYNPLISLLDKWADESWEIPLAEWYGKTYPNDDLVQFMNPKSTFRNLYDTLENGKDVYGIIGVGDSVVRERLFTGLTSICGKSYDEIYEMWLNKGRKKVC